MKKKLSDLLEMKYGVTRDDFLEAKQHQAEKGITIGDALIQKKVITEVQLLEAYSLLYEIPFWPELPIDNIQIISREKLKIQFLKKYIMVPLVIKNEEPEKGKIPQKEGLIDSFKPPSTIIAINNLSSFQPLDDLVKLLDLTDYEVVLSTKSAILSVINLSFDFSDDSAEQIVKEFDEDEDSLLTDLEATADLLDDTSDAPIIKLVNHIISQAAKARASDIHFEPEKDSFKVRYRVDGILYDLLTPPKWIQPALTSRIKVMAKLNIAEKRLPQDGRFEVKIGNDIIDIRVSTLPIAFGERVVMRLLIKSGAIIEIDQLGFSPKMYQQLEELIQAPNGIILVTGPTGSGKTTTLYSMLSTINKPDINIITIEDPVEYQLKGISQIQVNPKIDLTFSRGLRAIVRQDPDVILIGEIRDKETAEIAVQSALTGHLVFSTIHTNDSPSTITRLVDLGVEPFLISSSVLAILAQRLVRKLCDECKQPYDPGPEALNLGLRPEHVKKFTFYKAVGCEKCFNVGYKGRLGIYELMVMGEGMRSLILKTYDSIRIKHEAINRGMVMLRQDGIEKVLRGITTIEEVYQATHKV